MNRNQWLARDGHPPADLLLLNLEDELDGSTAEAVREHLGECAPCRLACEQLELGLSRFTAFRDNAGIPIPAPRTEQLRSRIHAAGAPSPSLAEKLRGLFHIHTPRRLAFAFGGLSLGLVVWISFFLTSPRQSVYASQLLSDARSASDSLIAQSKVLNQKIRLRRGSLVIERSVHHGRPAPLQADEPKIDPSLQQYLNLARVNINDPLNADDFALWRASQKDPRDTVKETQDSVTITTRVAGSAIAEGSLTLSRSGWRPIARSAEVRGEDPIEISELSYDITASPSLTPEPAIGGLAPGAAENVNKASLRPEISRADLEASELDLREAFHAIGADVTAAPEIWIGNESVFYHPSAQRPTQQAAIRAAAERIPHVTESDKEQPRPTELSENLDGSGIYSATPPLADALKARLGDAKAAESFVSAMRTHSSRVLAEADALDELARRYPVETVKTLPPSLQTRVNRLAANMLSTLQHDSADYLKSLSPTLDGLALDLHVAEPVNENSEEAGCITWQQSAALAKPQLRILAGDTSLMFIRSRAESPAKLNAMQLMADTLKSRSFLQSHLMSTCQLFSTR